MAKVKFTVDPTNLDRSAAEAFQAHTAGRLPYAEWKQTAAQIERLRGVEAFRRTHGEALHNSHHPEHAQRAAELQTMYEQAYPEGPVVT
jgi:hypothetical protein